MLTTNTQSAANPSRHATGQRAIDIEKLLHWVYRDELCKGGSEAWSPWDAIFRLATLGVRVDDQLGPVARLPPIFGDPHPDALLVARYVGRLPHRSAVLVTIHAKMATRPAPWEGPICVLPVRDGSRVRVVGKSYGRASNGRWRYYTEGSYCPLRFEPSLSEVAWSRSEWTCWRDGLIELQGSLAGQLDEHQATGPELEAEPWNVAEAASRILYATNSVRKSA